MSTINLPEQWQVKRLSGSLGAEITGLALKDLNSKEVAIVKQLLLEHLVVFFPEQHLTADAHVAFGEQFGTLEGHPNLDSGADVHPKIFKLEASRGGIADEWHTDLTFQESPAVMSILHMKTCPETGGDTMWANLYQAFNELSEPMQSVCLELSALHDAHPHGHSEKMAIHPVVRVHPLTNKKALYVNEHFTRRIVEMSADESNMLLPFLTRWVASPRFTVRYHWTPGTIGIWDNRCTQHFVINDFVGERIIERVTVVGDQVAAAQPSSYQPRLHAGSLSASSRHDRQLSHYITGKPAVFH